MPIEPHAAVLEVDLDAVAANWRLLSARHGGPVAGVLKADGYGLGAARVGARLFAEGCRHFFVALPQEAEALRPHLPGAMLGVLNGLLPGQERDFAALDLTPVLGSLDEIARWRQAAPGRPAILHVDTGMARLGLGEAEVAALADDPALLAGLPIRYVMTHLVAAEVTEDPMNSRQAERFARARAMLPAAPASFANSSGIFLGAAFASDLARPGAALYGINPTPGQPNPMRQTVRILARVLQVRDVRKGEGVGYNATWIAPRDSRIAVIGVGYADGWLRALSSNSRATVAGGDFDGAVLPLVGRVSMDLTTFDATDVPGLVAGDRLELLGPTHPPDSVAREAGTNGYEILTSLGRRYARTYRG